jgi:arginase
MTDRRILVPAFLDREFPELLSLSRAGDIAVDAKPGKGDQTERVFPIHQRLAGEVEKAVLKGERPVAIFGDCCQVIPVLAGLQRAGVDATLIWIDAHGDFNTSETTPSGFLGGMPLAMITGRGDQRMMKSSGCAVLPDTSVILCGARDLDPGEKELLNSSGVRQAVELDHLWRAPLPEGPLYVHFDSDVVDCNEAPAFLYPVKGGPSVRAVADFTRRLAASGRVAAVSMTVWDIPHDACGKTQRACMTAFEGLVAA